ncbi:MAG: AAA family ATPase, partial [Thiogranum sp.]
MRISRLAKIRQHRLFRDFVWSDELPNFAQFNVIYGWNGSGKTTLSSLFENFQDGRKISVGEVEFTLDSGDSVSGADIPDANLPPVRVFNRDFVAKTIDAIDESNVAPIYFLGKESIEKQKQAGVLKAELQAANEAVIMAERGKRNADKVLDDFCIEKAKLIKEALLGSTQHANYDKRSFRQAVARIKGASLQPEALSEEEKATLQKQKELKAKANVSRMGVVAPDVAGLRAKTSSLLDRAIASQVIAELASDPAVGSWVQQGLSLHKGERQTDTCRFCGNGFSSARRAELEAHFNDAFASFQREIDQEVSNIDRQRRSLGAISFPDESRFYDHLVSEVKPAVETASNAISAVNKVLDQLKEALEKKKGNPFEQFVLKEEESGEDSSGHSLSTAIGAINDLIDKHEATTTNLNNEIRDACRALEKDYVLDALPRLEELEIAAAEAKTGLDAAKKKPAELREKISTIEREIIEHRRPAEELNRELRAYLGRDELQFDIKDTGYALSRSGQPASGLSEGERTAIAFLYFLKSLEDKDFELSSGVVVIDDPVSSLDANALFSAFGYMKERTRECHQLFILTHNFAFFRQVKNWFHHLKGQNKRDIAQRPARFYSLHTTLVDGKRNAAISRIDPLLEEYESEYHFLFRQVHEVAIDTAP